VIAIIIMGIVFFLVVVHLREPTASPKLIVWEKVYRGRIKYLEQQIPFVRLTPTWGRNVQVTDLGPPKQGLKRK
jgi:hypothetical protein